MAVPSTASCPAADSPDRHRGPELVERWAPPQQAGAEPSDLFRSVMRHDHRPAEPNVFIKGWQTLKHEEVYLKGYADGHQLPDGLADWSPSTTIITLFRRSATALRRRPQRRRRSGPNINSTLLIAPSFAPVQTTSLAPVPAQAASTPRAQGGRYRPVTKTGLLWG
jgi:hypothetical protein